MPSAWSLQCEHKSMVMTAQRDADPKAVLERAAGVAWRLRRRCNRARRQRDQVAAQLRTVTLQLQAALSALEFLGQPTGAHPWPAHCRAPVRVALTKDVLVRAWRLHHDSGMPAEAIAAALGTKRDVILTFLGRGYATEAAAQAYAELGVVSRGAERRSQC